MPADSILPFPHAVADASRPSPRPAAFVIERIDRRSGTRVTQLVQIPDYLLEIARWLGDDAASILEYAVPLPPQR